ncbi:MAG: FliA/WhiG family RNA polymerase sigma factor [Candidatus Acidiferrales bacterium]
MIEAEQGTCRANNELERAHMQELVIEHLPSVYYIARRIRYRLPPQVLLEDLVHAGVLGLMDAVRKFDPARNVRLKYYAEFRIRGAIIDSLREDDWIPRTLRRQSKRLDRAIANCKRRLGRDPTEPEIADELQVSLENLQRLTRDLHALEISYVRTDANKSGSEKEVIGPRAVAEEEDPFCRTLRSEMMKLLTKSMDELPGRERDVLTLYHFGELSMKAVGSVLGIGESRVSQIHTAALVRLRSRLQELLEQKMPRIPA